MQVSCQTSVAALAALIDPREIKSQVSNSGILAGRPGWGWHRRFASPVVKILERLEMAWVRIYPKLPVLIDFADCASRKPRNI
jgi:hypothetical protein